VESRATTHFAQNFQLYQMTAFETMSDKSFLKVKNGVLRIFKKSHSAVIFESFQYIAIDRGLRELSKSLFTFDPTSRFHRKKTMTKGGL